jgi:hypothetical protein
VGHARRAAVFRDALETSLEPPADTAEAFRR